jgi:two-component system chemotaxis response regulator CheB
VSETPVTVLVIDDSPINRRTLTEMLESSPDVEVLDRASDGEEGLKKAASLRPDLITLDLEMPKLDGFAFLRLLMATVPTPVIVVSSYAHKSDVFKALELGAFDFIAKPYRQGKQELAEMRQELIEKVRSVRLIRPAKRETRARPAAVPAREPREPLVVAVAASTGGPPAVQKLLEAASAEPSTCFLVCQHMPARFTRAFAARLDRAGAFTVTEAHDGDLIAPGHAFIAPGGKQLSVEPRAGKLALRVTEPKDRDKHAPSGDLLFESVAKVIGARALGIVLTGMGADGADGARALKRAGAEVWAESEESAVIFGMPKEAIAAGAVKRVLRLSEMGPALVTLARKHREASSRARSA